MKYLLVFLVTIGIDPGRPTLSAEYDYADYPDDGSSSEVAPTNPVLLEDSPQYVTGILGQTTILTCPVKNLGDFVVIWSRQDDKKILAIGEKNISPSSRYSADIESGSEGWPTLTIKDTKLTDRGVYECEIPSFDPIPLSLRFNLTIVSEANSSDSRINLTNADSSSSRQKNIAGDEPIPFILPPKSLQATNITSNSMLLTWVDDNMPNNQTSEANTFYTVEIKVLSYAGHTPYRFKNTTIAKALIDNLSPNTKYEFTVQVVIGERESAWSPSLVNRTQPTAPDTKSKTPKEPTVNVTGILGQKTILICPIKHSTNYTVLWRGPSHLLTVGSYYITSDERFLTDYQHETRNSVLSIISTKESDRGVYECKSTTSPQFIYKFNLTITEPNSQDLGLNQTAPDFSRLPSNSVDEAGQTLSPPTSMDTKPISANSILVSWGDALLPPNQTKEDIYFTVRYSMTNDSRPEHFSFKNTTDIKAIISNLEPNTVYSFSVKIVNGEHTSPWSRIVGGRTRKAVVETFEEALEAGDNDFVVEFLKRKGYKKFGPWNRVDRTALLKVVKLNHTDVAKTIVPYVDRLDHVTQYYYGTPLMEAAKNSNTEIMQTLIDHGALITSEAMNIAAEYGQPQAVSFLLSKGVPCTNEALIKSSAVSNLASRGYSEVFKILVACGADVNVKYRSFETPVMRAAKSGRLDAVSTLVELGANLTSVSNTSIETALTYATQSTNDGISKVIKYLIKQGTYNDKQLSDAIASAATRANNIALVALFDAGAKFNSNITGIGKWDSDTPLLYTVVSRGYKTNYNDVVQTLIENGANVEAADKHGKTPLYKAIKEELFEIFCTLLRNGANATAIDEYGGSDYLKAATKADKIDFLVTLLELGADPNNQNVGANTPIYFAAYEGRKDMVSLIMDYGGDINLQGELDETALIQLADSLVENVKGVRILLEKGANPNIVARYLVSKTALSIARSRTTGYEKLPRTGTIKALLEFGAKH